ncbi:ABC transporter substrate-binding protein [Desulfobacter latus]|uniref:ABC transporter substrate-binding protein n=1 Tax=Desulfobacter latus TaxID=2292 RepID=A0A850SZC3_9BACT|nr:ABC transporter substrate-binding protein [Desulfobacter latus]NWH05470.1 ABC transporter substrate-binding protein [Desulfobacter latus]
MINIKSIHHILRLALFTSVIFACLLCQSQAFGKEQITVEDFRGKTVQVPVKINRVITISDGLIEGVMTRLGEAHKIVALGSQCIPRVWTYDIPNKNGGSFPYKEGMNTITYLNPNFKNLPLVAKFGVGISYERVAELNPDLIIIRTGSCALNQGRDILDKTIGLLDSLGVPLVVLHGPNATPDPGIESISREIRILGKIFQKEDQALALAQYLASCVMMVRERTEGIVPDQQKRLLLLGLSPKARTQGGAGHVKGVDTLQTYFLEQVIRAKNAFTGPGAWNILNTEQLLALDPDLVVLVTAWGYHPPEELYFAPYYEGLQEMRAVKNKAVVALPWTPCNCEKRLEYPIDIMVMAKAAYPERFKDINLNQWLLDFYQTVYKVDKKTADELLSRQWMGWVRKE